ncbi:MAG: hypothetical protein NT132_05205 [Microbacterium sp.]|uniref:hypothetical protein n=1 Tax=Microbacterium sp. TaxID=51671 RepID=UPI00260D20AA|nr:hypothetical protein [Microbacterium sp.]MCX6501794.1 hypothetical protein [Microbacterium sp.]
MTFSAVRRAEAQRIAAERAAAEKAAAAAQAPPRPSFDSVGGAPVLIRRHPPATVRASQFFWILATFAGASAATYLFLIRKAHVPDITERVRAVDGSRAPETYASVAEILSWTVFGVIVGLLLVQIVAQVSYANRRPRTRWWMLGALLVVCALLPFARELVAFGDRGRPLAVLLIAQAGLLLLGLLFAVMPPALRWTAERHDVAARDSGPDPAAQV